VEERSNSDNFDKVVSSAIHGRKTAVLPRFINAFAAFEEALGYCQRIGTALPPDIWIPPAGYASAPYEELRLEWTLATSTSGRITALEAAINGRQSRRISETWRESRELLEVDLRAIDEWTNCKAALDEQFRLHILVVRSLNSPTQGGVRAPVFEVGEVRLGN
jgi:hypothetical protein